MINILDMITNDIEVSGYVYPNENNFIPTYWNFDDIYSNIVNNYYKKYYTWGDNQLKYHVLPCSTKPEDFAVPEQTPPSDHPHPHPSSSQNSYVFIFVMLLAFVVLLAIITKNRTYVEEKNYLVI